MNEYVNERVVVAQIARQVQRRVYAGLRQRFRDRGDDRRPAGRPELAAALSLRSLCRAALGHAVHGTARHQQALVALSHAPDGAAHLELQAATELPLFRSAPTIGEDTLPLMPLRWDPAPIPDEKR